MSSTVLQVGDLAGDLGGVEAVAVGDQLGLLGRGEDVGGEQPVQRGLWLVVEAACGGRRGRWPQPTGFLVGVR